MKNNLNKRETPKLLLSLINLIEHSEEEGRLDINDMCFCFLVIDEMAPELNTT